MKIFDNMTKDERFKISSNAGTFVFFLVFVGSVILPTAWGAFSDPVAIVVTSIFIIVFIGSIIISLVFYERYDPNIITFINRRTGEKTTINTRNREESQRRYNQMMGFEPRDDFLDYEFPEDDFWNGLNPDDELGF